MDVTSRGCTQNFPDWPPGARTVKWYRSLPLGAVVSLFLVSFAVITLCVASQRVFIVVGVYFVVDLVRKLRIHCRITFVNMI